MAVVRWDPFQDLVTLQDRMNQIFEQTLARSRGDREGVMASAWSPPVDIYETAQSLISRRSFPASAKRTSISKSGTID